MALPLIVLLVIVGMALLLLMELPVLQAVAAVVVVLGFELAGVQFGAGLAMLALL